MQIVLKDVGKKFNQDWIFRDVSFTFPAQSVTAILGRNGSGKSTLLQLIAGNLTPTSGSISYSFNGKIIPAEEVFTYLAIAAPYLELVEDFTLQEMVKFHFSFKSLLPGIDQRMFTDILGFKTSVFKQIRQFSSGMKQRVKLTLAILSNVPLILLDEPTMNLDQEGVAWYLELMKQYSINRTVIICSNLHQTESAFAGKVITVEDYKGQGYATK
jgi:ABC-type multidrug transport system ATPase subunit